LRRVTGKIEFPEDKSLEERLFCERPWVKDLLKSGPKDALVAMFRIAHGEVYFWTMENTLRERYARGVTF
jgi:uncharacterized pyridoxamine 5'-phosphate oxidase family protein